ncbi:MAG: hypothetical protein ABSF64_02545 [Bryobacteraceae bacterium]|jgi:hypothetical protein
MTSKKKAAASRRNARHSSGPKTDAGKAASSMNAVRHGLRARTLLLPDEKQEDFDQLHADLENQYQPQTPHERHLLYQAAIAQWMQLRADRFQREAQMAGLDILARVSIFDRMTQASGRLDRSYTKACDALERLKAARPKPPEQPQADPPPHEKNGKKGKGKDETPPARYQVTWMKGDGQSEVLYRAENGIPVKEFSDAPL